ncbi:hypothetical protein EYF80_032315 [Liparis tanakae]|uniref:Uncharacterized protein n=1 Tax=Liparis tanakae TaxID=230148 RepID=A0A4Z2GW25_9TELE|nr:hypothetical protein EYF80_032315 [Liparis tanakae]
MRRGEEVRQGGEERRRLTDVVPAWSNRKCSFPPRLKRLNPRRMRRKRRKRRKRSDPVNPMMSIKKNQTLFSLVF